MPARYAAAPAKLASLACKGPAPSEANGSCNSPRAAARSTARGRAYGRHTGGTKAPDTASRASSLCVLADALVSTLALASVGNVVVRAWLPAYCAEEAAAAWRGVPAAALCVALAAGAHGSGAVASQ
jgi:hypothetical protein